MRIYLIDTENVSFHGLAGAGQLEATDTIYLLCTQVLGNSKIGFDQCWELCSSKATKTRENLEPKGKNYLDMQLATIAGQVMEQHEDAEVVIISKDRDYQAVIDYWTKHGRKISMAQSIEQYLNPQKKTAKTILKIEEAYISQTLAPKAISKENGSTKAQSKSQTPTIKEAKPPKPPKAQQQQPKQNSKKAPNEANIEAYRQKVAEILKELFPNKSKASITKYSKSIAAKKEKKALKDYCISAFADNKNNYRVYSRICKIFPY